MYFTSMKQAEYYGYTRQDCVASIHRSGSVKGMKKAGFWPKNADVVRIGSHIYLLKK